MVVTKGMEGECPKMIVETGDGEDPQNEDGEDPRTTMVLMSWTNFMPHYGKIKLGEKLKKVPALSSRYQGCKRTYPTLRTKQNC